MAEVLCIQHEYGLYGQSEGKLLLTLLDRLRIPVVTTLHTTLGAPSARLRTLTRALCDRSAAVVVMSRTAALLLRNVYDVEAARIHIIPHGCHWVEDPWKDRDSSRSALDLQDRATVMTFGLMGPNKGIEYALRALPAVVAAHPDVLYQVVGATHPGESEASAESYRTRLEGLVDELGLADHVRFEARYLTDQELRQQLSAADVYLLPYVDPEQVSSGTLGWAMGLGRAIVSTEFRYAVELLGGGDGRLVPIRDSQAIALELIHLLEARETLTRIGRRAHAASRHMRWEQAGARYHELFARVQSRHSHTRLPCQIVHGD